MNRPLYIYVIALILIMFPACGTKRPLTGPHRWQQTTIDFYINKKANILSETVIRETFQKWGEKTHFTFVYKGRNKAGIRKDGKNTVSFLLRWPQEIPINNIGYCKNWYDSNGNIIESDIILNMQLTTFTTLKTNTPDAYYVEGVVAHEIGHMLGLGHISQNNSVMKKKSNAKESYFKGIIDKHSLKAYTQLYKKQ